MRSEMAIVPRAIVSHGMAIVPKQSDPGCQSPITLRTPRWQLYPEQSYPKKSYPAMAIVPCRRGVKRQTPRRGRPGSKVDYRPALNGHPAFGGRSGLAETDQLCRMSAIRRRRYSLLVCGPLFHSPLSRPFSS